MKHKICTTLFICTFAYLHFCTIAVAQNWQWAKSALGNQGDDEGHGVGFDNAGNVYVTGRIQDSCDFEGTALVKGMFVAKYDSLGNLQWAKESQGTLYEAASQLRIDDFGNSYIIGTFRDTAGFDGQFIYGKGGMDIFYTKYESSGNFRWVKSCGSKNWDNAAGIAVDLSGRAYIAGSFSDTIYFGSDMLTSGSSTNTDIFVARYDDSGNFEWARKIGSGKWDYARGIAVDNSFNYYVTGNFKDTLVLGSTTLISKGIASPDFFVAKYDAAGNVLWAKQASGKGDEEPDGIAVDANGNVFVTGYFTDTVTFGSLQLISNPLNSGDIFTIKYDAAGNELWVKQGSSSNWDESKDIALDNAGGCYITGGFSGNITFDSKTLTSSPDGDVFIVKYDANGNVVWATQSDGSSGGQARAIAADGNGAVYVAGQFDSTMVCGSSTLINFEIVPGDHDIFVAKLKDTTITTSIKQFAVSIPQMKVSVYPNPFSNNAEIRIQNEVPNAFGIQFTIYNLLGETVRQFVIRNSSSFVISRDNLPDGIYFYKIQKEKELISTGKLVIQ